MRIERNAQLVGWMMGYQHHQENRTSQYDNQEGQIENRISRLFA